MAKKYTSWLRQRSKIWIILADNRWVFSAVTWGEVNFMPTLATQKKYHIRAVQLIFRAKKEQENEQLNALQIAEWLMTNKHDQYSKATWRQYRAALVYVFTQQIQDNTDDNSHDLSTAIVLLQKTAPPSGLPDSRQTSAQKQKKMGESDLIRLMDYFNGKPSRHGLATQAWILSGLWTGLRPCEWEAAQLTASNELVITNAKATQGRSHGITRTLDIADLTEQEQQILCLHFEYVQQAKMEPWQDGVSGFERFYSHCRSCLYEATRALWPKRKQFITLYSARHQFSANAKHNDLPLEKIAALMGHASIETATAHYGRRSAGNGGGMKVTANNNDVARVIALNHHRLNHNPPGLGM